MIRQMFFLFLLPFLVSCNKQQRLPEYDLPPTDLTQTAFIPLPQNIQADNTAFPLDKNTVIITHDTEYERIGRFLKDAIGKKIKDSLAINPEKSKKKYRGIYIHQVDSLFDHDEGYQLKIRPDSIQIEAQSPAGAFRGIQTLMQSIPNESVDTVADWPVYSVPTGTIVDKPRFNYRGAMLDVARHFFTVDEVKKYIDLLAYYKFNHLHLHLTDDQGWRIEIKSWPKLTETGGKTEVGNGEGGFYTQEEFKELIAFASDRYITIVPEVDMPGHTNAASLSYPFLNGNGKEVKPYTGTRVGFSTFDTRKDTVYQFLDDVIQEIASLTPGPYFHIGGDESHVTLEDDYKYFVEKVQEIVHQHGKRMVGWDEIASADIDSTSVAQFWSSTDNAKEAARKGMKVILSPAKKIYLDMKYDQSSEYGLNWAAYITPKDAYDWNPEEYVDIPGENILGIEAPLWSETISNSGEMEYLAFPRIIGVSELAWSQSSDIRWENYKQRLAAHAHYLKTNNVNYFPHPQVNWKRK